MLQLGYSHVAFRTKWDILSMWSTCKWSSQPQVCGEPYMHGATTCFLVFKSFGFLVVQEHMNFLEVQS